MFFIGAIASYHSERGYDVIDVKLHLPGIIKIISHMFAL